MTKPSDDFIDDTSFEAGQTDSASVPSGGLFDLSGVKADVRGTPPPLPNGVYNCIVEDVTWGPSKNSGSLMLTWVFKIVNGEHASRQIYDWTILKDKNGKVDVRGLAKLKAYLQVVAPDTDLSSFDPAVFAASKAAVNALCMLKLKVTGKAGEERNNVIDIMPYNENNDLGLEDPGSELDIL